LRRGAVTTSPEALETDDTDATAPDAAQAGFTRPLETDDKEATAPDAAQATDEPVETLSVPHTEAPEPTRHDAAPAAAFPPIKKNRWIKR